MICELNPSCPTPGVDTEWDSRDAMLMDDEQAQAWRAELGPEAWSAKVEARNAEYFATLTAAEAPAFVAQVAEHLNDDWWDGLWGDTQDPAAVAFMKAFSEWFDAGSPADTAAAVIPDVFAKEYIHDLAGELRLGRGWCPHAPVDAWAYGAMPIPPVEMRDPPVEVLS